MRVGAVRGRRWGCEGSDLGAGRDSTEGVSGNGIKTKAGLGSEAKKAIDSVCVCVCVSLLYLSVSLPLIPFHSLLKKIREKNILR